MISKTCGLLSVAWLLITAHTCFAQDQWAGPYAAEFGPKAKAEFAALSENGRTAFRNALIACGLYVDEPINAVHKGDCKVALKGFVVEFSNEHSAISLLFNDAIIGAEIWEANIELDIQHGRREPPEPNPAKADIADLQKIYRDTPLHTANLATKPRDVRSPLSTGGPILIPLQREGGTFVVPVLINKAITLNFIIDSGAADVSIPADVVSTLIRTGTLQDTDFLGTQTYTLADGSKIPSPTFRIRSLKADKVEIGNVRASVANAKGDLLLGQKFPQPFQVMVDRQRETGIGPDSID